MMSVTLKWSDAVAENNANGGKQAGPLANRPARQLIMFLHGSRGYADQMQIVAEAVSPILPEAVFCAPNGLLAGDMGKFQHFEIVKHYQAAQFGKPPTEWTAEEAERMDEINTGVSRAVRPYDRLLSRLQQRFGIEDRNTALIGFSQGGQMALHMGLRRQGTLAAIVSMSGTLLDPDSLPREIVSRPPILLTHGEADTVLPIRGMKLARDMLVAAGCGVETRTIPNADHHKDWILGLPAVAKYLGGRMTPLARPALPFARNDSKARVLTS